jgi:lactoylglutathione lyase
MPPSVSVIDLDCGDYLHRELTIAGGCRNIPNVAEIASIVLFAAEVDKTAEFYRAIGLELEHEDHGEGPVHFAMELGGVHFAIYPTEVNGRAPARRAAGSSFPGFYVAALDEVAGALRRMGATVLTEHEQMPWGCRVVVEDPDGRAIEINDRTHCPHRR